MRPPQILFQNMLGTASQLLAGVLICLSLASPTDAEVLHRYSFEGSGKEAIDNINGAHGSILGGARLKELGNIDLDGHDDYVELPPGIISKLGNASFEVWTTWDGPSSSYWERIFDFGRDTSQYLYLSPRISVSPKNARFAITQTGSERKVNGLRYLAYDKKTQHHIVVAYDDDNDTASLFIDGDLQNSNRTTISLKNIQDDNNWLGRSQFTMIPYYDGRINEFRIHDRALGLESVKASQSLGPEVLPGPLINAFRASKSVVRSGEKVKLIWDVTAADNLEIDGLPAISGTNGFMETTLTQTSEFMLKVSNADGSRTSKVQIIVDDRPVIQSFTASKYQINPGETITLSWDSQHADTLNIDGISEAITNANGAIEVRVSEEAVYTLTATNAAGRSTASVRIRLPRESTPVISEVKAWNTTREDEDGEYSDWLELHNPGATAVELAGWQLTDNKDRRGKWTLPAFTLQPGEHLLIYCSGKNKTPENEGELHTNFRLSVDGSYLALSKADGTIVHEFDPGYPPQFKDYSYGISIREKTVPLVGEDATYSVFIPSGNAPTEGWIGSIGLDEYDDSLWRSGKGGVGSLNFESDELRFDLDEDLLGKVTSLYVRVPFEAGDDFFLQERLALSLNFGDGFIAYLNGKEIARSNAPPNADWNTPATKSRSGSEILMPATFNITDAGSRLRKGRNILAIQLLNFGKNDPNFFLKAELNGYEAPGFDLDAPHFLYPPSPNKTNNSTNGPPLTAVIFSLSSQPFKDTLNLTLSHPNPGVEIRYTTDRRVPTASSTLYSAPIQLNRTTQIRARAFGSGFSPSPTQSHTYVRLDTSVQNFSSNLPIVVVDSFGSGKPTGNDLRSAFFTLQEPDKNTGRAKVTDPYKISSRSGVKVRGSSTAGFAKYALAMETWNEDDEDRDIKPLGLPANSDWVLSGRYRFDLALMRNPFIYELSNQMGIYAPRTRYVEVFMDTDGGSLTYPSNYMGVYALIEKIKRGEERVNIARMDATDNAAPDVTGGYLLKVDRADPGDASFNAGGQGSINHVYPKTINLTSQQRNYIRSYVSEFGAALDQSNYTNPSTGLHYREYFDVQKSIDSHLLRLLAKDPDGLRLSTYLYKPREGKLTYGPVWDFDRTLGCDNDGRAREPTGWDPSSGMTYFTYTWFGKMFKDSDFRQDYVDRYQQLRTNIWSVQNTNAICNNFAAQIREAQARNWQKWGDSTNGGTYSSVGGGWEGEVSHLKGWIKARVEWMDAQFLTPPTFSAPEGEVNKGSQLELTKTGGGTLYFTTDGTDPRLPGGAINPNANAANSLVINETTRVVARLHQSGHQWPWSSTTDATFIVGAEPVTVSNIAITEINYNPLAPTKEELGRNPALKAGDFEFIELKNLGDRPVNLNKAKFEDGVQATLGNYVIDSGTHALLIANPEAFRLRYGDDLPVAGTFTGSLRNSGEKLKITTPNGLPVQSFEYDDGNGWPDRADGNGSTLEIIDPNGTYSHSDNWRSSHDFHGSPGRDGSAQSPEIVINEALTHTDLPQVDSIELYNSTETTVDISGWWLTDNNNQHAKFQIPSGSLIAAGSYLIFDETDFNPTPLTPQEHHFSLNSAKGDDIYLLKGSIGKTRPLAFCDHVEFGSALNGVVFGRSPNGDTSAPFVPLNKNTLGEANSLPRFGPVIITEILAQPRNTGPEEDTNDLEYIEIHNSSANPVDLTNWRLRKGIDFDFPANTVLPARGTLAILSFNPDKPENRDKTAAFALYYGVQVNSRFLGGYKGSLNNAGETIHLQQADAPPAKEPEYLPHPLHDPAKYTNADPWPVHGATGKSLHRTASEAFGLLPGSWTVLDPTPGTHGANVDSDADGLPDDWETQYFPNHDPGPDDDFDGDGQNNLHEYHAGSDPTELTSAFTARTTEESDGTSFTLSWFSVPGKIYDIQFSEDLTGTWQNLRSQIPAASIGNSTEFTDVNLQGKTQRYYRITVVTE